MHRHRLPATSWLHSVRKQQKPKPTQKKPCKKDRRLAIDFVTDQKFDRLLDRWFGNASRVLQPWRGFFIWGGYAIRPFLTCKDRMGSRVERAKVTQSQRLG
jgi:hypothetical protein